MGVKFIVDSASDVLPGEAEALGVIHLPLAVSFGDETFSDSVDLSHSEFFEKLSTCQELPTTSQIPPTVFEDAYRKVAAEGDQAVVITVSSKLSGTYQSAVIAAADHNGQVFVVDSLSAAIGERVLLQRGLELAKNGLSAEQVAKALDEEKKNIRVMAMIDTLEYLKKGGRISATTAFAGGLLGIKPAVEVKDGAVVMAGTARGRGKCNDLLYSLVEKYGGVNCHKPVAFVYSGKEDSQLRQFCEAYPDIWQGEAALPVYSLGCAIGAHIGPGAYGVAFFEK